MPWFFCIVLIFSLLHATDVKSESIVVEISRAKTKVTSFAVECSNTPIKQKLTQNLLLSGRFKTNDQPDLLIKIQIANDQAKVEVIDAITEKIIRCFVIQCVGNFINKISDYVYSAWLNEDGLFCTSVLFAEEITPNLSVIASYGYDQDQSKSISSPISYISDMIYSNNEIYISKFYPKTRGFAVFAYDKLRKKFYKTITINNISVFSPALLGRVIYVSASSGGTTGIYKVNQMSKSFDNFTQFEKSENTSVVSKIQGKIATSISVNETAIVFCANFQNIPAIFWMRNGQPVKISPSNGAAYYSPVLFDDKIAAIKVQNGVFQLVTMHLDGDNERALLSKYYIGKPAWSPCGNWIAISCREANQKNTIILIHKSGKYSRVLKTNKSAIYPIWIKI